MNHTVLGHLPGVFNSSQLIQCRTKTAILRARKMSGSRAMCWPL